MYIDSLNLHNGLWDGTIVFAILKMKKLRYRENNLPKIIYPLTIWQNLDSNLVNF